MGEVAFKKIYNFHSTITLLKDDFWQIKHQNMINRIPLSQHIPRSLNSSAVRVHKGCQWGREQQQQQFATEPSKKTFAHW